MYASTITLRAFDSAFARYNRELQEGEDFDNAFERYCDEVGRDIEDPESLVWFEARLQDERDAQY